MRTSKHAGHPPLLRFRAHAARWSATAVLTLVLAVPGTPAALQGNHPAPPSAAEVMGGPAPAADPVEVDWRMLAGLDHRTGEVSPALQALDGEVVRIPGFMVPLEDGVDGVGEFLLVPYFGACIHTPPPPPNQIVYVKMDEGEKVTVNYWDPIWMEGRLQIRSIDSPYGEVGHQLVGLEIRPYEWQ